MTPRCEPIEAVLAKVRASLLYADWPIPPRVRALSTLRGPSGYSTGPFAHFNFGSGSGDDPTAIADNRLLLCRGAGLPTAPCWLQQVHGTHVVRFPRQVVRGERLSVSTAIEADAAVSTVPGIVLAILSADCLPVLIAADNGREIAAAHAGWRGLAGGVLEATLAALDTAPAHLQVWLGPGIGASSYEVGAEVYTALVGPYPEAAVHFVTTRPGHWACDLVGLARQRLKIAGVTRIFGGDFDTCADPRFYSYRRDGLCSGRLASLIWMEP